MSAYASRSMTVIPVGFVGCTIRVSCVKQRLLLSKDPSPLLASHTCVGVGEQSHSTKWFQEKERVSRKQTWGIAHSLQLRVKPSRIMSSSLQRVHRFRGTDHGNFL